MTTSPQTVPFILRVPCPTCGAYQNNVCHRDDHDLPLASSHPARWSAAQHAQGQRPAWILINGQRRRATYQKAHAMGTVYRPEGYLLDDGTFYPYTNYIWLAWADE